MSNQSINYYIEELSNQIKEAKETNNLKTERVLKGFSRLLSIFKNIYKIVEDYEDFDDFAYLLKFYSYVTQIFCKYLESYIKGKRISLDRLIVIVDCLTYGYAFNGGGFDQRGNSHLSLVNFFLKEGDEFLNIPIPITKTEKWYNDLKSIN